MIRDCTHWGRVAGSVIGFSLLLIFSAHTVYSAELEPGLNTAGVILLPTALDQPVDHTLHITTAVFDLGEPDIRAENVRYGFQLGNTQIITDIDFLTEPEKEFDRAEIKVKLRLLTLDDFLASFAIGLLSRITDSTEGEERIDDKPWSFLGVFTVELFPIEDWGGILLNVYLDNRIFSLGAKVQLIEQLQIISETINLHSTEMESRTNTSIGLEVNGEQNFYFQLFYNDLNERFSFQLGAGF